MQALEPEALAEAWLRKWSSDPPAHWPIDPLDGELTRTHPQVALAAILVVLSRIPASPEDRLFQVLAAGPLENLLAHPPNPPLEEIDRLARQQPSFRLLLNGVWWGRVAPPVRERLAKYCTQGW